MLLFGLWVFALTASTPASAELALDTGASGGSAAVAAQPQGEVLDFTADFVFEQKVFAPGPATGCKGSSGPVEVKELTWMPCDADGYDDMCSLQAKHVKERAARITESLKPYTDAVKEAYRNFASVCQLQLGPVPPKKDPRREAYAKLAKPIADRVLLPSLKAISSRLRGEMSASADKVLANIEKLRATFRRALANAPKLGANSYLLEKILNCKLKVVPDTSQINDNAAMGARVLDVSFPKLRETTENGDDVLLVNRRSEKTRRPGDGFDVLINPLEEADYSCDLHLNPATWIECAELTPGCVETVFHELGHTLNSCNFLRANAGARWSYDQFKDASVDSLKHAGVYSKFLAGQTLDFAHTLMSATSCLSAISSPHDAVPDSCPRNPYVSDEFYRRCGNDIPPDDVVSAIWGYPAQWDEAEADFWGATGVAQWLQENYRTEPERRRAFFDIWSEQCATRESLAAEASRDEPRAIPVAAAIPKAIPACHDIPQEMPRSKAWGDPHQTDAWRTNRNFIRNSDLRRALGCPEHDPRIPLTCSPVR